MNNQIKCSKCGAVDSLQLESYYQEENYEL